MHLTFEGSRVGSRLGSCLAGLLLATLAACGGGGGGGTGPAATPSVETAAPAPVVLASNELEVIVDRGTDGTAFNAPFVTVTVCEPGTSTCKTIDHVLLDTGSYGLRLAASAVGSSVSLPVVANAGGVAVAECAQFGSGWAWGSVRRADVRLGGERAANLPVQIVADPAAPYAQVPTDCSNRGANFGVGPGANGVLGVGMLTQDCGQACVAGPAPATYFACSSSACSATALPLASQVANPVASFATNKNGVLMTMPAVGLGGVGTLSGRLIFGIDTQPNNQLGSATVYQASEKGRFTVTYKGASYPESFIDSGSNAIFFPDPGIAECAGGFYCPPSPLTLSAVNTSVTGRSGTVEFTIEALSSLASNSVAGNVGADIGLTRSIDWGLPFFFGRTVFVAMSGASTSKGTGPFWAF